MHISSPLCRQRNRGPLLCLLLPFYAKSCRTWLSRCSSFLCFYGVNNRTIMPNSYAITVPVWGGIRQQRRPAGFYSSHGTGSGRTEHQNPSAAGQACGLYTAKKIAHKFNVFTLNSRAILVGPAGFGKPRPKNSPLDCFYPAGRGTPGTGCSNSAYVLPPPFITNKKMQPPARLHLGWAGRI